MLKVIIDNAHRGKNKGIIEKEMLTCSAAASFLKAAFPVLSANLIFAAELFLISMGSKYDPCELTTAKEEERGETMNM